MVATKTTTTKLTNQDQDSRDNYLLSIKILDKNKINQILALTTIVKMNSRNNKTSVVMADLK